MSNRSQINEDLIAQALRTLAYGLMAHKADLLSQEYGTVNPESRKAKLTVTVEAVNRYINKRIEELPGQKKQGKSVFQFHSRGNTPKEDVLKFYLKLGRDEAKLDKDWMIGLLEATGYSQSEVSRILEEVEPIEEENTVTIHNLPDNRPEPFVGYHSQLEEIQKFLQSDNNLLGVTSKEGFGKSALVCEAIRGCIGSPRGEARKIEWPTLRYVLYFNLRNEPLSEKALFNKVAIALGRARLTTEDVKKDWDALTEVEKTAFSDKKDWDALAEDKKTAFSVKIGWDALTKDTEIEIKLKKTLIILDNYEAGPVSLDGFPKKLKIIVIGRDEPKGVSNLIKLRGLLSEDAVTLLYALSAANKNKDKEDILASVPKDVLITLAQALDYSPYALKSYFIGLVGLAQSKNEKITNWVSYISSQANKLELGDYYQKTWDEWNQDEKQKPLLKLWTIMGYFRVHTSVELIRSVANCIIDYKNNPSKFYRDFHKLQTNMIVERVELDTYRLIRAARVCADGAGAERPAIFDDNEVDPREQWIRVYYKFILRHALLPFTIYFKDLTSEDSEKQNSSPNQGNKQAEKPDHKLRINRSKILDEIKTIKFLEDDDNSFLKAYSSHIYWNTLREKYISNPIEKEWANILAVLDWFVNLAPNVAMKGLVYYMIALTHQSNPIQLRDERIQYGEAAAKVADQLGLEFEYSILSIDTLGWKFLEAGESNKAIVKIKKAIENLKEDRQPQRLEECLAVGKAFLARAMIIKGKQLDYSNFKEVNLVIAEVEEFLNRKTPEKVEESNSPKPETSKDLASDKEDNVPEAKTPRNVVITNRLYLAQGVAALAEGVFFLNEKKQAEAREDFKIALEKQEEALKNFDDALEKFEAAKEAAEEYGLQNEISYSDYYISIPMLFRASELSSSNKKAEAEKLFSEAMEILSDATYELKSITTEGYSSLKILEIVYGTMPGYTELSQEYEKLADNWVNQNIPSPNQFVDELKKFWRYDYPILN